MSLFKIIILGLFIYVIYSIFRFIFTVRKSLKMQNEQQKNKQRKQTNNQTSNNRIIELDDDQYKVE